MVCVSPECFSSTLTLYREEFAGFPPPPFACSLLTYEQEGDIGNVSTFLMKVFPNICLDFVTVNA